MIWGEAVDRRARQGHRQGRQDRGAEGRARRPAAIRPSTSSSPPARGRACCPGLEPDKKLVWTYFEAMVPDRMPKSLLVIGSGAIGIEFASFYRTLGAEVTVVEVLPQILPVEDAEISAFARKQLREAGHQDPHRRQGDQARQESRQRHRHHRRRQGRHADARRRARDLGGRRRRQYRESRPGEARREDRARHHRDRRAQPHQRARHLRHRRRRRSADAGAQGRARGRDLRRGDQGAQAASDGQAADPRLHLLLAADRLGRPHRAGRQGEEARHPRRPLSVRRQRQGDRARRGPGARQGDLRQEDRRSSSARTWSAPKSPS